MNPSLRLFRPWMRQSSGKLSGLVVASMGLTLAAVTFSTTTGAFQTSAGGAAADIASARRRQRYSSIARCESPQVQQSPGDEEATTSAGATALSTQLSDNIQYERLNSPARLELHTHAVSGLFSPNKIARYEIYKRLVDTEKVDPASSLLTPPQEHLITALVDFGDSLDGHPGIVHGGILSLVLDDIFGFAFWAIGVPFAVTANLSVDYRTPTPANTSVMVRVYLDRRENRKIYFKGEIISLDGSVVFAESTCLYIIPRAVWEKMGNEA